MTVLSQIFLDRRKPQPEDADYPIKRRWSDFPANRQAAMAGRPIPLNRKPMYSPEDIQFVSREELKNK